MTTVEIKGNFLNFLASINDSNLLREMLETCIEMAKEKGGLDDMPREIRSELEEAVRLSYDDKNLIPHESVQQEVTSWLQELRG